VDLAFNIDLNGKHVQSSRNYIQELKTSLKSAYAKAKTAMENSAGKNKARYDASARAAELEPGDRVLIRQLGPKLNTKIADRWESEVYVVISKSYEMPVYTVKQENGMGSIRTLHRNMMLPIGMLDAEPDAQVETSGAETQRLKPQPKQRRIKLPQRGIVSDKSDESDESVEWEVEVSLRPEAPVFVPRPKPRTRLKDDPQQGSSRSSNLTPELSPQPALVPRPKPRTRFEDDPQQGSSRSSILQGRPMAEVEQVAVEAEAESSEKLSSGEEETEPVVVESNESSSSDEEIELEPVRLRRSTRTRKPVERLNLVQRVEYKREQDLKELMKACQCNMAIMIESMKNVQMCIQEMFSIFP
jgi:hypothetical protein